MPYLSPPTLTRAEVEALLRAKIAKGGRAGIVFLPDALLPKLRRVRRYKVGRGEIYDF